MSKPRVYMAGKIRKNCWRHQFVDISRVCCDRSPFDHTLECDAGNFIYTGPFFIGCDHGCSHGENTHGLGEGCFGYGYPNPAPIEHNLTRSQAVVAVSFERIKRSDVIYAWIDETDCFGTLVELGYAKALGKKIAIQFHVSMISKLNVITGPRLWRVQKNVVDDPSDDTGIGAFDMWFVAEAAEHVAFRDEPNLQEALRILIGDMNDQVPVSPKWVV